MKKIIVFGISGLGNQDALEVLEKIAVKEKLKAVKEEKTESVEEKENSKGSIVIFTSADSDWKNMSGVSISQMSDLSLSKGKKNLLKGLKNVAKDCNEFNVPCVIYKAEKFNEFMKVVGKFANIGTIEDLSYAIINADSISSVLLPVQTGVKKNFQSPVLENFFYGPLSGSGTRN